MEISQNHGDNEIFYIYQKFIRYCLPEINVVFYSTKASRENRENCYIKLYSKDEQIIYQLNPETRLFEEEPKRQKKSTDVPKIRKESEER